MSKTGKKQCTLNKEIEDITRGVKSRIRSSLDSVFVRERKVSNILFFIDGSIQVHMALPGGR